MVNVLRQLYVKYYIVKEIIFGRNFTFKITRFRTYVYVKRFLCFDKNSLMK
jgi:hypothetical protein